MKFVTINKLETGKFQLTKFKGHFSLFSMTLVAPEYNLVDQIQTLRFIVFKLYDTYSESFRVLKPVSLSLITPLLL